MRGDEADERALLTRVAQREDAALEALYDRCSGAALAVARRLLRSPEEAEEALQETFMHVWQRARDYQPARGTVRAWVCMIARSRALDRIRAREGRAKLASHEDGGATAAAPPRTPAEELELGRDRVQVLRALQALPLEQRRALELAFFEGLTQSEIAQFTREPLGTVKTRIRRGMEKLSELLQDRGS